MKVTIQYQRPLRGMSRNMYPGGGIELSREVRTEGLNGVDIRNVTELSHVFRLEGHGEYELEVTPHNMRWLAAGMRERTTVTGVVKPPEWSLKYEEQMSVVEQFVSPEDVKKEIAEDVSFTEVVAEDAPIPKKRKPGRPKKATAKPKAGKAAPVGDNE